MYGQTQNPPADYYTAPCPCGFRRWGSHTQECADAAHGVTRSEHGVAVAS